MVRLAEAEKKRRVEQALEALDLTQHRSAHPLSLPKGDRARVVIAAILVMNADILVSTSPPPGRITAAPWRFSI